VVKFSRNWPEPRSVTSSWHSTPPQTGNSVVYISLQINTLLYTLVSVLVMGTGIARSQYYWMLDIGCLVWYCCNPRLTSLVFKLRL